MSCWSAISRALAVLLALLLTPSSEAAPVVQVAGNSATAQIAIDGVVAELILQFDDASGLSAASLGVDAELVDLADPALLARLPSPLLTSLPAALPLLITVEPPSQGGLSLRNTVRVELHTHALAYSAGSHFRLFRAPLGGAFHDITDEVAPGSVRTRGSTGGFSQFLVLIDLRPSQQVINDKFQRLEERSLAAPLALRGSLQERLQSARAAYQLGQSAAALAALDDLRALVSAHAGSTLGNQWTPNARDGNLAGDLLAGAASLKFSIGFRRDYGD